MPFASCMTSELCYVEGIKIRSILSVASVPYHATNEAETPWDSQSHSLAAGRPWLLLNKVNFLLYWPNCSFCRSSLSSQTVPTTRQIVTLSSYVLRNFLCAVSSIAAAQGPTFLPIFPCQSNAGTVPLPRWHAQSHRPDQTRRWSMVDL